MSIRSRLVVMCLVVALLPAVPLTFLVRSLLDKSLNVALNPTVETALQSGIEVSRRYLDEVRLDFNVAVQRVAARIGPDEADSSRVAHELALSQGMSGDIDGFVVAPPGPAVPGTGLPPPLRLFGNSRRLAKLIFGRGLVDRPVEEGRSPYAFLETDDHSAQLAVWTPQNGRPVLFYKQVAPEFLERANQMLDARQKFAELRLLQRPLTKSFFYPFVIIYGICLALALALALWIAERLADPIRQLATGANIVAEGDWDYHLDIRAGGETGRLVDAFNEMVDKLESQRRRLSDMEKMAAWREMARHLAHEIKNPLLPIRLTIEELRDQYHGDDERFRAMLAESTRVIADEVGSLQKLVKEFSAFAKMPDMNPTRGSLESLARDVAKMYPAVSANVRAAPGVPDLEFDADQMRRVFVNLFDNAVSVASEAKPCEVGIVMEKSGGEVTIELSDNGPGIAAETIEKIFDPYFTTRAEGTGLGLAMVKKIILLHGGSIIATSTVGLGVTFTIRLPVAGTERS